MSHWSRKCWTTVLPGFQKSQIAKVTQWYNRTKSSISLFENEVTITDEISQLNEADLYILAVSDDNISEISKTLLFRIV